MVRKQTYSIGSNKNKHETLSMGCGGVFGNTKLFLIFLFICDFIFDHIIWIAYLITSFKIAIQIELFVTAYFCDCISQFIISDCIFEFIICVCKFYYFNSVKIFLCETIDCIRADFIFVWSLVHACPITSMRNEYFIIKQFYIYLLPIILHNKNLQVTLNIYWLRQIGFVVLPTHQLI